MQKNRYSDLLQGFSRARILVVGDVYLDENVYGKVTGVSLEAPVPILEVHERLYNPGAAGNAACNVASLGAKTYMIGVVGDDANAAIVREEFERRNVDISGLVTNANFPTNTYGKLRAGGFNIPSQEMLRTDTPTPPFIEGDVEDQIIAQIEARAAEVDAIIVTDQISSVATSRVLRAVTDGAKRHGILIVGDSRQRIGEFDGFDVVVPNEREAGFGVDIDVTDEASMFEAGNALARRCKSVLITRGPGGITIFEGNATPITKPPAATHIADVTGAGDTVTAAVTLSIVAGASRAEAAIVGNAAAAVAVAQRGVVAVTNDEVRESLVGLDGRDKVLDKIRTLDELKKITDELKARGKTIVWTNGCFDIVHPGHITYLLRAAREGDVLVLGLNSDESIRAVKGPNRPIIKEDERALVMSALECVDYVTIFSEQSPGPIIELLQPDVYSKGGDYTIDTIDQDERRIVESYGGRIAIIPGVEGASTTNIVDRLTREYEEEKKDVVEDDSIDESENDDET